MSSLQIKSDDAGRSGDDRPAAAADTALPDIVPVEIPVEAVIGVEPATPPIKAEMDLVGILSGIEETAYSWDMTTDVMEWETNVSSVLGVRSPLEVATGAGFQFLIAAEHVTRRQSAFSTEPSADPGVVAAAPAAPGGIPYRVQYRFLPKGRRSAKVLWLEDHGRWWPDASGRPQRARGVIRVLNDSFMEEQRLLFRADQDELTGQLNRIRLTEALAAVIARAERAGQTAAFLIASINNLSVINETFGFDVGDSVIASVGHEIQARLRGGDSIGRYSSNKFGIILNDCGPGAMQVAAERFIKSVKQIGMKSRDCPIASTISIGGLLVPQHARCVPTAISRALESLDAARANRHDSFVAYVPDPAKENLRQRNIAIANDVTSALDENRMHLVLQPIVNSKSRVPSFYECLLRIMNPDGSVIGAGEFIEIAEQLGMSRQIDRRTLELTIDLLKRYPHVTLSVNVSSRTCADPDWLVLLHRLTGGQAHLTRRLIVEITETTAISDLDQTNSFVDTLREMGCRVAIDDFGAGYTSFRNLKHLNCDIVKLDGAFVRNVVNDASDRIFVRMMSELGTAFGMETVAEWVTDGPTADIVEQLGITYLQGFHFGRPFEVSELDHTVPLAAAG